jgi:hypothetical protein
MNYQDGQPFPHIVIDDFFPVESLNEVLAAFPAPDESWWQYSNPLERKWAKNTGLPAPIERFIMNLNDEIFIEYLEELTGIHDLTPDFSFNGGGLHQISRGGKLDIHEDYNYHPLTNYHRRLNLLVYLNKDWQAEWKGNLELWNADMTECVKSIEPVFNRIVIFSTVPGSNHGHPDPLECPEGLTRKSIALYYYSKDRPPHEIREKHSTLFKRRPQDPADMALDILREKRSKGRI